MGLTYEEEMALRKKENFAVRICKEMLSQIINGIGINAYHSWGVRNEIVCFSPAGDVTLLLHVGGLLHTGAVLVTYQEGPDTYEVVLKNEDYEETFRLAGVYCDQLGQLLDSLIDRNPDWTDDEYRALALADSDRKINEGK